MSEREYEMFRRIVALKGSGGIYEAADYMAGHEMGVLEGQLGGDVSPTPDKPGFGATTDWRWIRQGNMQQVDQIAMLHGRVTEFGETHEDLIAVRLIKPGTSEVTE
ncbi:hypothetical protein HQO24_10340 [Rhodococcus fascians]|nr:hypothetical protein [Rhodococcus fascians]MBY4396921.1 hypothetical protein [Rhodococcus fascians]MBY4407400.1 hypothetical protein [Rhodococcus fascians]MBY4421471.1 hypothetical protein [Rhodococcus fascians]MBY4460776.1 hypothetical protein [Rhodococcus fascians]